MLVGFSLGQYLLEGFLSFRQYKVLQRTKPPKVLENEVSQKVYDQSQVCCLLSGEVGASSQLALWIYIRIYKRMKLIE